MSSEPLDLLTFEEPCMLNPPPLVVDQAPPKLEEPKLTLDEPIQTIAIEDAQSQPSPNHPGSVEPSTTNRRSTVTADFETSQRSISNDYIVEINSFFQDIRQEEFERINKKRRMETAQSGDSSLRNDNNQFDMPMASQPISCSHEKNKNDWCSSESLLEDPPMAGLSKGAANQQFPADTSLTPIAELKEISIDQVPPKTKSPPELDFPEASKADCPTRARARTTTEADFLVSARKFKPGYESDIARFFHNIRVEEARKMGRPEPAMHTLHWGSERRGQDWTPLESGASNTIPDDWGQPDEAQGDNLVGRGGQSDETQGNNSKDLGANHWNSVISPPVNKEADFSWNASEDAGQSRQAATEEHADFSWNDNTDAGPSKMATNQVHVNYSENKTPDAGPSKNSRAKEGPAVSWSQAAMTVPSKKTVATKALASKSKARAVPLWGSNNSHPHYEADEYVWGEEAEGLWSGGHPADAGPIIRTRGGNKGRGKRGGSHWKSGIKHPAIVGGNARWTSS